MVDWGRFLCLFGLHEWEHDVISYHCPRCGASRWGGGSVGGILLLVLIVAGFEAVRNLKRWASRFTP